MVMAASVPRIVAIVADARATLSVTHAASINGSLRKRAAYQRLEKPPHTVTKRDALKEYTTRMRIGRYRKAKPSVSAVALNQGRRRFIPAPQCGGLPCPVK